MSDYIEEMECPEITPELVEKLQAKLESQKKKMKKQKRKIELYDKQKEEIQDLKNELSYTQLYAKDLLDDVQRGEKCISRLQASNASLSTKLNNSQNKISTLEEELQQKMESATEHNPKQKESDKKEEEQEKERISYNRDEFLAMKNSEGTKESFEKLNHDDLLKSLKENLKEEIMNRIAAKERRISEIDDMLLKISKVKEAVKKDLQEKENRSAKDPLVVFGCIYVVMIFLYFIFY